MTSIPTPVTGLLGVRLPVIQAGMSWASSSSALPLAVTRAGGLGVVAAGPMRLDDLARVLDEMAAGTDDPWGSICRSTGREPTTSSICSSSGAHQC